jgi:hypothetical protein
MLIELDRPGSGVAALLLSVSTLHALKKNGTLADDELAGIVEQSLARLKALNRGEGVRSQAAWETALYLLEQLQMHFARDPSPEQTRATLSPQPSRSADPVEGRAQG